MIALFQKTRASNKFSLERKRRVKKFFMLKEYGKHEISSIPVLIIVIIIIFFLYDGLHEH